MKNIKNKIVSIGLISIGIISTMMSKDATVLLLTSGMGIPLFFSKENWIR